jgi:hypothetical protein
MMVVVAVVVNNRSGHACLNIAHWVFISKLTPLQLLKQLNFSLFRFDMMENFAIKQRNSALPTINRNGFE